MPIVEKKNRAILDSLNQFMLSYISQHTTADAAAAFPTKILIDPDGKIVKTYVGEDPTFYEFLDNTFGK